MIVAIGTLKQGLSIAVFGQRGGFEADHRPQGQRHRAADAGEA